MLARGSVLKAVIMVVLGLLLSTVGTDLETGQERLTLGIADLSDGIDFAVLAMGVFGIAEILRNLENPEARDVVRRPDRPAAAVAARICADRSGRSCAAPGSARCSASCPATARCSAPFASYTLEKKLAKDPSRFGKGAIEGVAGPGGRQQCRRPDRVHPAADARHPAQRGDGADGRRDDHPRHHSGSAGDDQEPDLFWGMIASMWIGNLMLLIINLPLIGLWVRLLKVPYRLMFTAILLFCCIGIYSINNNPARRVLHRVLRLRRLRADQARPRARADAARFRAGQADGGKAAAGARAVRGQLHDFRGAPGFRGPACCSRSP